MLYTTFFFFLRLYFKNYLRYYKRDTERIFEDKVYFNSI